ncbi:exodeoxyribonuclease 7 large subunit [Gottschalkia purinilytica]|uniref:Exodeoxyribonuclease 7 large subunit n=1 Tax=Gottschalkia purinilytica TaxID=1503 RepID=A0A0L0W7B6_GOTPU|nr:exodeoxyribonuclease VII large subunit [Gottschalkia purinilytica]KNF07404.1 exodeoxyribonuclease 7 large subunit [Gottschalkia purinilytica]
MDIKPLKVSELNQYIKRILISDPILYNINVEGEISNFKHHYNGNVYFTLKDKDSKLKCIIFEETYEEIEFVPKDGMEVVLTGYISVYDREGTYQLHVKNIKPKGIGYLYEEFEKLKKELRKEGLFDEANKKKLPFLPRKIGVITSITGAAIKDIINNIKRRSPMINILIYPVLVQGKNASKDICGALEYFNERDDIDVIILGRGGGSIEELWSFNEENVARSIFKSKIPIISAVGHETDFTISDFVSDVRASTPSVAAEISAPLKDDLNSKLSYLLVSLVNYQDNLMNMKKEHVQLLGNTVLDKSPFHAIKSDRECLNSLLSKLIVSIELKKKDTNIKLESLGERMHALSPLSVLNRGYAFIQNKEGKVIKSVEEIEKQEVLELKLRDGKIGVTVNDIIEKEGNQ